MSTHVSQQHLPIGVRPARSSSFLKYRRGIKSLPGTINETVYSGNYVDAPKVPARKDSQQLNPTAQRNTNQHHIHTHHQQHPISALDFLQLVVSRIPPPRIPPALSSTGTMTRHSSGPIIAERSSSIKKTVAIVKAHNLQYH